MPAHDFTAANPALGARLVWGGRDGVYTDDSDVVAVLAHAGWFVPPNDPLLNLQHVRVAVRLFKKEGVRFDSVEGGRGESRAWLGDKYEGCCMRVESVELQYLGDDVKRVLRRKRSKVPADVPGLVPFGAGGKKKARGGILLLFDLCNDPCARYECGRMEGVQSEVKDRLETEVLYVENEHTRYEVARMSNGVRFARVKESVIESGRVEGILGESHNAPLEDTDIEVLHSSKQVPWSTLYWDAEGVKLGKNHYTLSKMMFRTREDAKET